MSERVRLAVVGGGVAGLATVYHLLEVVASRRAAGVAGAHLDLTFIAQLVPHDDGTSAKDSEGSGLGGKAMSRAYEGRYDTAHWGMDRVPFYGPMLPHRGTIPHGYHVLWGYPNLRRMLRAEGEGDDLGGVMRPLPEGGIPGGSALIASFQGDLDDPAPGGPGVGLMGLVDPALPATATRPATRALLALRDEGLTGPYLRAFEWLFGAASGGIDPYSFADLYYAHEVDLELRITLILASLHARRLDPERATVEIDGVEYKLTDIEYDAWARALTGRLGRERQGAESEIEALLAGMLEGLLPDALGPALRWTRPLLEPILAWLRRQTARVESAGVVVESWLESSSVSEELVALLPDGLEARVRRLLFVYVETERVLRAMPAALLRLANGEYRVWRTLHFRFGPDATFASPHSFDAAQAARSLALCFLTPRSSRIWSADGGRIQKLWLKLWRRIQALAATMSEDVTLTLVEGRVDALGVDEAGRPSLRWGGVIGHGTTAPTDLGFPWMSSREARMPPALGDQPRVIFDAVLPTMGPALLATLLKGDGLAAARAQLEPLTTQANETLELLIWLDQPIEYAPEARRGLSVAAINGLEGPFCLLADYRCGLWSAEALGAERPFGPEVPFTGSVIESCGGMMDLFACPTRDDAFGWPARVKEEVARLLFAPEHFEEVDDRRWVHVDAAEDWQARVRDGTWSAERRASPVAWEDWAVASRWLVWGFLRQLSQVQALGPRAVRQFAHYAQRIDPTRLDRAEILSPPDELRAQIRYVVMRNANRRNRFFNPGVGDWARRPVSGVPLAGTANVFPAGDWTRNGLDVICMEGACLSGMRAARAAWCTASGEALPPGTPALIPVLPPESWYEGPDPMVRGPLAGREAP